MEFMEISKWIAVGSLLTIAGEVLMVLLMIIFKDKSDTKLREQ